MERERLESSHPIRVYCQQHGITLAEFARLANLALDTVKSYISKESSEGNCCVIIHTKTSDKVSAALKITDPLAKLGSAGLAQSSADRVVSTLIPSPLIMAIDGYAGTGKSSVVRILSRRLGMMPLDSGSFYRAVAYIYDGGTANISRISIINGVLCIDGAPVTDAMIRTTEIANKAALVGKDLRVRKALRPLFHQYAAEAGVLIAEGRDMTSVVFKDNALLKVFLEADAYVRAERIAKDEIRGKGKSLTTIYAETIWRDHEDETRADSPLIKVKDAIPVDSTYFTEEEVADVIQHFWQRKLTEAIVSQ